MDPIDSVSRAMQLLRRRLAGQASKHEPAAPQDPAPAAASGGDLRQAVAARVRGLDPDAPGFVDRATEAFVEAVLLQEFGASMTNDARFRQVILGVARDMGSDPDTARELEQLFRSLRAP